MHFDVNVVKVGADCRGPVFMVVITALSSSEVGKSTHVIHSSGVQTSRNLTVTGDLYDESDRTIQPELCHKNLRMAWRYHVANGMFLFSLTLPS